MDMSQFELPLEIYWADTDAGGIVYHAKYLEFFERARTQWLRSLGISQHTRRQSGGGMFVAVRAQLHYLRPARLENKLVITAGLGRAGPASVDINHGAYLQSADHARQLLCRGQVRVGWVDPETLKPQRIPADILNQLKS